MPMKRYTFILLVFIIAISCKKITIVRNLSGESYLCRTITNNPTAPYYGNGYLDSTIFTFEENRAIIKYPRSKNNEPGNFYDTAYYSSKRKVFIWATIWQFTVKTVDGDNFTAYVKTNNSQNIRFTAYFFKNN